MTCTGRCACECVSTYGINELVCSNVDKIDRIITSMDAVTHDRLLQLCWQHLWNTYPSTRYCAWHTKNESIPYKGESKQAYIIRRSQDKAVGLLPGVWDLSFYWKGVLHIFDVKIGKDKIGVNQDRFRNQIVAQGGRAYEIRELETFIQICKRIIDGSESI